MAIQSQDTASTLKLLGQRQLDLGNRFNAAVTMMMNTIDLRSADIHRLLNVAGLKLPELPDIGMRFPLNFEFKTQPIAIEPSLYQPTSAIYRVDAKYQQTKPDSKPETSLYVLEFLKVDTQDKPIASIGSLTIEKFKYYATGSDVDGDMHMGESQSAREILREFAERILAKEPGLYIHVREACATCFGMRLPALDKNGKPEIRGVKMTSSTGTNGAPVLNKANDNQAAPAAAPAAAP